MPVKKYLLNWNLHRTKAGRNVTSRVAESFNRMCQRVEAAIRTQLLSIRNPKNDYFVKGIPQNISLSTSFLKHAKFE